MKPHATQLRSVSVLFGLVALIATAGAEAAPKKAAAKDEPKLPAPEVKLVIEPGAPGKPWKMRVTNEGSVPLKIVADARLLRLDVEPPAPPPDTSKKSAKSKKTKAPPHFTCELPSVMRNDGRTLVLKPGASYAEVFHPRLFCLDRAKDMVAGTKISAKLGWSSKAKKPAPPFVVRPGDEGADVQVAAAKEIGAATITLDQDAFPPPAPPPGDDVYATAGVGRSFVDATSADFTVVLHNPTKETKALYPRPQLVDAKITNPRGTTTTCTGPAITPAPIVDFITRLPPKGTWSTTVQLKSFCPQGTFDVPGLYLVTPIVKLPPIPQLPDAVTGEIEAQSPQLLRIEVGAKQPFHLGPPVAAKP